MSKFLTYAEAGVDIDKAKDFVGIIKGIARQTPRTGVMSEIGGFGGLYSLNLSNMERPVLVSSTDGVGTKLKIAFMMDKHDTVGIDLVAMCVNDIIVQGAKPLFFLDYLAVGELEMRVATQLIQSIAAGCQIAQCALIGGETAEMPGIYSKGEYDLAGFTVGIVDNSKIIDGSDIRPGHKLIGIASSGLHSNGFSLVRKICFDINKLKVDEYIPDLGKTLGEELITPTRIYVSTIMNLIKDLPIHGIAHITGGGLVENLLRIIPNACKIIIHQKSWDIPIIFHYLQKIGNVSATEMRRTFNNGIGMVLVTTESATQDIIARLKALDEKAFIIGEVTSRKSLDGQIEWIA
ncbi:MAG: phosphoribosylformylglycinamidine cyclo-ligase [Desulfobacterales bacterium]|nr:phosphoribosylformylglycinamidine cyclo-ligase [Desulfobacterales bacterium]